MSIVYYNPKENERCHPHGVTFLVSYAVDGKFQDKEFESRKEAEEFCDKANGIITVEPIM